MFPSIPSAFLSDLPGNPQGLAAPALEVLSIT